MKKVILSIVGAVVVLGGGIGGYVAYENHQQAVTQEQKVADRWLQDGMDNVQQTTTTPTDGSGLPIDEVESIFKQQIGKDFTPDQAKLLISGYKVVPDSNHQYIFVEGDSKHYLNVTFNADETSVVKVEKH